MAPKAATMHLTNKEPIRNDALAASGSLDATGAPANEIEITPEMIEAGCLALSHYRYEKSNEDEIVTTIFAAMMGARCRQSGHLVGSRLNFPNGS